jgi:hypothetical protein
MEYRYSILRYQPTLERTERESFAVIVEGKLRTGGVIFFVGRTLEEVPSTVSDVSKSVAKKMPDILASLVSDAVQKKSADEDILDWVSRNMHWNFQATQPTLLEDIDPVHAVAFKLFAQHVAGAGQLVEYLEQTAAQSIRPPDTMQRLSQLEWSAVPVPA